MVSRWHRCLPTHHPIPAGWNVRLPQAGPLPRQHAPCRGRPRVGPLPRCTVLQVSDRLHHQPRLGCPDPLRAITRPSPPGQRQRPSRDWQGGPTALPTGGSAIHTQTGLHQQPLITSTRRPDRRTRVHLSTTARVHRERLPSVHASPVSQHRPPTPFAGADLVSGRFTADGVPSALTPTSTAFTATCLQAIPPARSCRRHPRRRGEPAADSRPPGGRAATTSITPPGHAGATPGTMTPPAIAQAGPGHPLTIGDSVGPDLVSARASWWAVSRLSWERHPRERRAAPLPCRTPGATDGAATSPFRESTCPSVDTTESGR